ncbi:hypothetical protein [Streptomyces sp. cg36]|uniref:hypothetical protein n=1 Tax=Streptomyces sp. cg36 TaxID=3238798 RepID=UPI0034E1AA7D
MVEIDGRDHDLDAHEVVTVIRQPAVTDVCVPGAFLAAASICCPAGLPGFLTAPGPPRCGTRPVQLRLMAEEKEQLADIAALTWWECVQDPDGPSVLFADAARGVAGLLDGR